MTYLHNTPPPQQNINLQNSRELDSDPAEPTPRYTPEDMGDDRNLNPARQRELLCQLHNRLFNLSFKDPADQFYKLTNSICSAQKGFSDIVKTRASNPKASESGGANVPDREQKIAAICDLVSDLKPADYDAEKLAKRAAVIAANYNATLGENSSGGSDDDA